MIGFHFPHVTLLFYSRHLAALEQGVCLRLEVPLPREGGCGSAHAAVIRELQGPRPTSRQPASGTGRLRVQGGGEEGLCLQSPPPPCAHTGRARCPGSCAVYLLVPPQRRAWTGATSSLGPRRAALELRAMAAAMGGSARVQHHRSLDSPPPQPPRRRGMDPRRRQAALSFLTNISLDGRPPQEDEGEEACAPRPAAPSPPPPPPTLPESAPLELEEKDAFASCLPALQAVAGTPLAAAGTRGRINSFTPGMPLAATVPFCRQQSAGPIACWTPEQLVGNVALELQQRSRRRLISQRSSLETLEDIEENAPLRRCRTLSGSPRPKNFKKVHFIKNMRQHDTRNGRIVLISGRRSFCSIFSVLPYQDCAHVGDLKLEGGRQRHSSGGVGAKETVIGLEGVELGANGKTVSYTQFLFQTNALGARRNTIDSTTSFSQFRNASHRSLCLARANSTQGSVDTGSDLGEYIDYDPNLLDDPQWPCGKHKRVLTFPSYMTTVIEYVKPSDLKKDMNETFKEKFPYIKLTLSKIRSLKRDIRKLAQDECGYEEPTVAMAFVYFEKLALKGKLNKQNRKLCAGACVLLAAKIGSDLRKHEVKHLIDKLEEKFRLNRRELMAFEFPVLVALEFALHLPEHEVMPHYRRLTQSS